MLDLLILIWARANYIILYIAIWLIVQFAIIMYREHRINKLLRQNKNLTGGRYPQ